MMDDIIQVYEIVYQVHFLIVSAIFRNRNFQRSTYSLRDPEWRTRYIAAVLISY